jgi:hypothetical protein
MSASDPKRTSGGSLKLHREPTEENISIEGFIKIGGQSLAA